MPEQSVRALRRLTVEPGGGQRQLLGEGGGVEVGVAGASAALSQTILESYFGERTVRALAAQAREALESLAADSLADVVAPIAAKLDRSQERERVEALALALDEAREALA